MLVRVKVYEDLPVEVAELFREAGHDASTVVAQGMTGASDAELWKAVEQAGQWLVTADKGLADPRSYPPGTHGATILFRLPRESRAGYVRLTGHLLSKLEFGSVTGSIVVVGPGAIRVYRPRDDPRQKSP